MYEVKKCVASSAFAIAHACILILLISSYIYNIKQRNGILTLLPKELQSEVVYVSKLSHTLYGCLL